jgi:aspartyl-tRNA(Asn)/glutamyl-tRNA(Gln) amidotransferase subunit C
MKVDRALIEHLGTLARLTITPEQVATLRADLQGVLDHVATLPDFPLGIAAPLAAQTLRADCVHVFENRDAALAAAPVCEHDTFVVPKVLE